MQFEPFLDEAFCRRMRQFLRLGNQNGKAPQQYGSIPFFHGIRVHIISYVLTVSHPVANIWIGEFHFASTDNLSSSGGCTSAMSTFSTLDNAEHFSDFNYARARKYPLFRCTLIRSPFANTS
jgi:hypothetical protein